VVIENLIFGAVISLQTLTLSFSFYSGRVLMTQFVWALISSPIIFYIFDHVFNGIDKLITGGLREKV
jgi:hypothetical protein